jgi:hypothetical protein
MFKIPVIQSILRPAEHLAKTTGKLNGSIQQGQGNLVGYCFQIAFHRLFGGKWDDTYDYDIFQPNNFIKQYPHHIGKFECKAKERKPYFMEDTWEASVTHESGKGINQECDFYTFGSVTTTSVGHPIWIWILGSLEKEKFLRGNSKELQDKNELDSMGKPLRRFEGLKTGAEFRKKGNIYDYNNFRCKEDCWNRRINELDQYYITDLSLNGIDNLRKIAQEAKKELRYSQFSERDLFGV